MKTETANRLAEIRAIAASGITETVRVTREQDYYGFARFAGMEVFDLSSVERGHVAARLEWEAAQKAGRYEDADAFRALYEDLDATLFPEKWADDEAEEEAEPTSPELEAAEAACAAASAHSAALKKAGAPKEERRAAHERLEAARAAVRAARANLR